MVLLAMLVHLRRAGIRACRRWCDNLAEARKPAYFDTAAGRVALIAATTFYPHWTRAADQRPDAGGRPGVNPIEFTTSYTIDEDSFTTLATMNEMLGMAQARTRQRAMFFSAQEAPEDTKDALTFLGQRFLRGKANAIATKAKAPDVEANLRWIREAKRQADFVIFSLHNHEFGRAGVLAASTQCRSWQHAGLVRHRCCTCGDRGAGADVVRRAWAASDPLQAEIYREQPILYSLGNFIFQNDNVAVFPAEAW